MRLTPEQVEAIHCSIKKFFKENYELYLYGSRADDSLKGGDIDLLIVTSSKDVEKIDSIHLDLLVEIKKQKSVGDRRIDLKVATQDQLASSAFLKMISKSMIKL